MDPFFFELDSDEKGLFPLHWPEPIGYAPAPLSNALWFLGREDFARCGRHGRSKALLVKTDAGFWVLVRFMAFEPSGGAALLMGEGFKSMLGKPVRFDFDLTSDPYAEELYDALLNDAEAFEKVYSSISGGLMPPHSSGGFASFGE